MSGAELARRIGLNKMTVSRLLNGRAEWQGHHLEAVAHALGVDPRALLPGPAEGEAGALRPIPNPAPAPALNPAERALLDAARAGDARGIAQAVLELAPKPAGER